ncbi:hypothetical protein MVEG_08125 [Podila verticillata NRRL 6337]|nr:hypothetical protein MVEG_08125 [Podila verticillata NRRL 6337]
MSESEESDHASPSAVPRTVLHAHEYDRVRHPQGHASRRSRQRSRQTSSSTHDWSDEDSRGNVRMARRESITSSFATTRTLPPPNISRIARLNVGTLDRTDLKLRIQELNSSLASRQRPVEDAQKTATEQGLELHRDESEDRSVTVAESDISSSIHNRDSTLERSHEIEVADREDLNMIDGGTSESMVNYGDEVRYDLRNIRDEIHDMLAALERSKMESRQLQQWVVERSELERQLREEWSTTNTEAQRVLLQQQRQIELASQRTSSHGFHDSRASRRHTSTSRSREHTSSQEAKESSIDDLSSDSTPPPNLAKKRNRTHLLIRRSNIKEFEQDVSASDASSEYRDPDKPENPATGLEKIADEGNEGVLPTMNRQRGHVRSFPWRVIRICFWILFTLALHILLMGLLFRPIALVEDRSVIGKNSREHRAPFIRYKGRDYISGQPGFYTFLSDGFGTDSLAYCHDMVHYPGHEDKSWGSSFLRYVLDGIDHAHERWASLPKVSWNGPLQQLHAHWSPLADRIKHMTRRKNKDDTLDWVFAEQQVQAQ